MLPDVVRDEVAIGGMGQIPPGEGRMFEVADRRVAVFRSRSGEFYATQADCPHLGGPLADGMLGGAVIVCPLHDRSYDLHTGHEIGGPLCLRIYQVRAAADGTLLLTLPPD